MIDIKDIQGNVIYSTGINKGAKRKFTLMKEDYVTLPFSLEEPVSFPIGSYAEIDGMRYEIVDLQKPTLNNSTGGYDYQLRLDAYYWKWKNKIFKFTPEVGGQEASWSLTASLDVHLGIFLRNLEALGYTYEGIEFGFSIDATVENKALALTYENMNMIDALSAMAEAAECEWWVKGNVIHFGRCEQGEYTDFEIGVNVEEMSSTASQSSYATRLYVFGSTRNIPANYRPLDNGIVANGIVQRRLMLPEGISCIDAYENMSQEEAIEEVVILDDIYPKTEGNISSVETYDDTVENEDGTTTTEAFYRFKDDGITFSYDYILEGEELKIQFTSGSLNGMEFSLAFNPNGEDEKLEDGSWNPEAQLFEIVANEDYGRKLPDATLNPKVGDTYTLIGWDASKIADLGLVDKAEDELFKKGCEISAKRKIDPNTYNCKMSSDYMYGLDNDGNQNPSFGKTFEVGDRVNLINSAYFENGRQSRIIGFEYNLDYPFDSPVFTVGETAAYSRLGALESKLDAITLNGQTYQGGNGIDANKFLRKDKDDRSKGKVSTDKAFEVGKFVAGASGAIIQVDKENGQTLMELDKLYVRMKAYFETLEIINVNSIGGKMILSPAGSVKCIGMVETTDAYRCYFLAEQDGEEVENRWEEGMQAYSQMFNAKEGVSNKISNKYYWRLVTGVGSEEFEGKSCHYIDLSKTDCDANSDVPSAGDVINHRGCRDDEDYMNFIEFSSVGLNAPYITLFQGVNSYSLVDKEYVSFGYDQATGRAYMNVYGDMYFGNRDGSSYIKYTPETGLEVCGKLTVGSTYNGIELGELIHSMSPEGYQEFVDKVLGDLDSLQNQVDGAIDSYFYEYDPSDDNYPAMEWDTDAEKESHLGDTFTNNLTGDSWRWGLKDGEYTWIYIKDTATKKALATAAEAKDTADGKRRVFTSTPYTPYDEGDLWAGGSDAPLMVCVSERVEGSYVESDWDYADNAEKIKAELNELVESTKSELDKAIEDAEAASKNYTDEGKAEIQKSIDAVNAAKANIDDVYSKAIVDGLIDNAEADAIAKANEVAQAERDLLEARVNAYADGQVTQAEQNAIDEAQKRVDVAKSELEEELDVLETELRELVNSTASSLNIAIGNAEKAANEYTDEAKGALQTSIKELEDAKANIANVYNKSEADAKITQAETDAIDAAKKAADAAIAASEEIVKAYADGIVDEEEAARIKQAQENLDAAKAYAEEKAKEAFDNAMTELAGYEYLKTALGDVSPTEINQGLVLTSLIQLRNESDAVMAGANGTTPNGDSSIAFWAGGQMLDRENGYASNTNAADFLVRMDGTGYAAGGNLSWDATGKITANPLSFFVGEETVGALLTAFKITSDSSGLATLIEPLANFKHLYLNDRLYFGDIPMYKSKDGVVFIEGNLVVQGGVTMYGSGTSDVPSIMDSIAVDGTTIINDNGVLKLNPDLELGGFNEEELSAFLEDNGYMDTTKLQDYLTSNAYLNVTEGDGRYLKLSGGTLTGTLNFDYASGSNAYIKQTNLRATESGGGWAVTTLRMDNAAETRMWSLGTYGTNDAAAYVYMGFADYDAYGNFRIYSDKYYFGGNNVGIGVISPSEKLHVVGNVKVQTGNVILGNDYKLVGLNKTGDTQVYIGYVSSSNNVILGSTEHNAYLSGTTVNIRYGGASGIYLGSSGNVGVGTTSPAYKLDVMGTLRVAGKDSDGTTRVKHLSRSDGTHYKYNSDATYRLTLAHNVGSSGTGVAHIYNITSDGQTMSDLYLGTTSGKQLALKANGQVGIGTTSPSDGYKLHVDGKIKNTDDINSGGVFYGGGKTSTVDGVAGCVLGASGIYTTSATNPFIRFFANNATNVTQQITASEDYLTFSGKTKHGGGLESTTGTFSKVVDLTGSKSNAFECEHIRFNGGGARIGANTSNGLGIYADQIYLRPASSTEASSLGILIDKDGVTNLYGALKVQDIKISQSKDGVLYIDGNVVVKGGVTMYGTDSTSAPSILDSLPVASTSAKGIAQFDGVYFTVSDGKVSLIPDNVGLNEAELSSFLEGNGYVDTTTLQDYLTSNAYMNVTEGDGRYLKLSGGTLTGQLKVGSGNFLVSTGHTVVGWLYPKADDECMLGQSERRWSDVRTVLLNGYTPIQSNNIGEYAWTSSNDGSGSGLDADMLDGLHGSQYRPMVNLGTISDYSDVVIALHPLTNTDTGAEFYSFGTIYAHRHNGLFASVKVEYSSQKKYNSTSAFIYAMQNSAIWFKPCTFTYGGVKYAGLVCGHESAAQFSGGIRISGTWSSEPFLIEFKKGSSGTVTNQEVNDSLVVNGDDVSAGAFWMNGEKEFAFTDSNVASATKLATERSIWGQSFNGTADIANASLVLYTNPSGYTGGWARGVAGGSSDGTTIGAFGLYGVGDVLKYAYIGAEFSSPWMSVLPNGNVGIGTTAPSYKLHVAGTIKADSIVYGNQFIIPSGGTYNALRIVRDSSGGGTWLQFGVYDGATTEGKGYITGISGDTLESLTIRSAATSLNGTLTMQNNKALFHLHTDGTTQLEAVRTSASNNLLLGNGHATAGYDSYLSGNKVYLRYGKTPSVGVVLNDSGNLTIGASDSASTSYKLYVNGDVYAAKKLSTGEGYLQSATTLYLQSASNCSVIVKINGGTEAARFSTNGNVGIGVTSPEYKLHIGGTTRIDGATSLGSTLSINGITLSKSKDGVLYIDGNVVVKGGVTMYGTDSTSAPSILDSLPVASTSVKGIAQFDGTFFTVSDGKVSLIPESVGLNEDELSDYLTSHSYLTQALGDARYLKLSGGTVSGNLTIDGGAASSSLIIKRSPSVILFKNSSGTSLGYLGFSGTNTPCIYTTSSAVHTLLTSGNYTDYTPILNSSSTHATKASVIYAPTTGGTSGQVLKSDGDKAPVWVNQSSLSVGSATKATQDGDGNVISDTYLKLSGGTLTGALKTTSVTPSANNTYSLGSSASGLRWGNVYSYGVDAGSFTYGHLYSSNLSSAGWYRIAVSNATNGRGGNYIISIARYYSATNNESYQVSVSVRHGGKVSFTQISGGYNTRLITKIRCVYKNSGEMYFDIYYNSTSVNTVHVNGVGNLTMQKPAATDEAHGLTGAVEFELGNGLVSTEGNVASATKLETDRTIWGQSFNGTADVSGNIALMTSKVFWHGDKSNYYISCPTNSTGGYLEYKAYAGHSFCAGGNAVLAILPNGNVGIGVVAPANKLEVRGKIKATDYIYGTNVLSGDGKTSSTDGVAGCVLGASGIYTTSATNPFIRFFANNAKSVTQQITANTDYLLFSTDAKATGDLITGSGYLKSDTTLYLQSATSKSVLVRINGGTEIARFSTNGNVGIGTTSPSYKLHVNGTTCIADATSLGGSLAVTGATTLSSTLTVSDATTLKSTLKGNYWYLNNSSTNSYLRLNKVSQSSSYWYLQSISNAVALGATSALSLKVDAEGNVVVAGNLLVKGGVTMYGSTSDAPTTKMYLSLYGEGTEGDGTQEDEILDDELLIGATYDNASMFFGKDGISRLGSNIFGDLLVYGGRAIYIRPNSRPLLEGEESLGVGQTVIASDVLIRPDSVADITTAGVYMTNTGNAYMAGGLALGQSSLNNAYKLYVNGKSYMTDKLEIAGTTTGSYKLYVKGAAYVTGTLTQNSDIRLKDVHKDLVLNLDKMADAPCFEYHFKDDEEKLAHVGTSAQYWESVDGVTRKDDDGRMGMDYSSLGVVMAISLAKELSKFESETDRRIRQLEEENEKLREEINKLKSA